MHLEINSLRKKVQHPLNVRLALYNHFFTTLISRLPVFNYDDKFLPMQKVIEEGVPISKISKRAQGYLLLIKQEIGEQSFSKLIAQHGAATLMFAIDTSGSMRDDIDAAKSIATSIVNRERDFPVDYVLSPFNDPG